MAAGFGLLVGAVDAVVAGCSSCRSNTGGNAPSTLRGPYTTCSARPCIAPRSVPCGSPAASSASKSSSSSMRISVPTRSECFRRGCATCLCLPDPAPPCVNANAGSTSDSSIDFLRRREPDDDDTEPDDLCA